MECGERDRFATSEEDGRGVGKARVGEQQAQEFTASVATDAKDGRLQLVRQ